jgi:uncharacterized protein (TIGR02996 family)
LSVSLQPGFLADICEHPDDVGRRLIFIDWLEDNDPDRAEFIRLQLRLDDMPDDDPERFDLEERALDLLAEHREEWLGDLPAWALRLPLCFRRGLPGEMRLPPGRFLSEGERLVRSAPLIRLTLDGIGQQPRELARLPALGNIPELVLDETPADAARLRDFLRHFSGERLRHLGLQGKRVRVGSREYLSSWPGLERLTSLSLRGMAFPDSVLAGLLASPGMGRLQRLDLSDTRAGPRAAVALARSERLAGLRYLDLGGECAPGDAGLRALTKADWQLQGLRLFARSVSPDALQTLADAPWMEGLSSLEIDGLGSLEALVGSKARARHLAVRTGWDDLQQALAAFCRSDLAAGLTSLRLTAQCNGEDLAPLVDAPNLSRLQFLSVGSLLDESDVICRLIESGRCPELRRLALCQCGLRSAGLRRLARMTGLARLVELTLWGEFLSADDIRELARSPYLTRLRRLNLSGNAIGTAGIQHLLGAPWLTSLRELRLYCSDLNAAGLTLLANCQALEHLRLLETDNLALDAAGAAALADSPYLKWLLRLRIGPRRPPGPVVEQLRDRFGSVLELWSA